MEVWKTLSKQCSFCEPHYGHPSADQKERHRDLLQLDNVTHKSLQNTKQNKHIPMPHTIPHYLNAFHLQGLSTKKCNHI